MTYSKYVEFKIFLSIFIHNKILAATRALMAYCEKKGKIFKITGTAGPDDVYLIRYYVVKSKYFNFFIHQFLRSDRDDLHDHPWHFLTYLVDGAYKENKWNEELQKLETMARTNDVHVRDWSDHRLTHTSENRLVFRRATDQHQVVVYNEYKLSQKDQATITICLTGPTMREWGFIREHGEIAIDGKIVKLAMRTWVHWKEYLGLPPDTPGRG